MSLHRSPAEPLRPFVKLLWLSDDHPVSAREHVLPTGAMHIAIRLDDVPLCLVESGVPRVIGTAVIGGVRATFHVRDVSRPSRSVGAMLRPGASRALLGPPAGELAGCHTPLELLWGRDVDLLREQLRGLRAPAAQLAAFESFLVARVRSAPGPECALRLDPAMRHALRLLDGGASVRAVENELAMSPRRFIATFRDAIGLAPKRHGRVVRFQRAVAALTRAHDRGLAAVALDAGYSDQAHLTREFHEHAGMTPRDYRRLAPPSSHHVPEPAGSG